MVTVGVTRLAVCSHCGRGVLAVGERKAALRAVWVMRFPHGLGSVCRIRKSHTGVWLPGCVPAGGACFRCPLSRIASLMRICEIGQCCSSSSTRLLWARMARPARLCSVRAGRPVKALWFSRRTQGKRPHPRRERNPLGRTPPENRSVTPTRTSSVSPAVSQFPAVPAVRQRRQRYAMDGRAAVPVTSTCRRQPLDGRQAQSLGEGPFA